jgi:5-methylcytosine-specific restriction endonuclease McrA
MREWRSKNPSNRDYQKQYWETYGSDPERREVLRKRASDWYYANKHRPEVQLRLRANTQRRRARIKAATDEVDYALVVSRADGVCGICNRPLDGPYHFDHIVPLALGGRHATDNLQLSHPRCNLSKKAKA